MASDELIGQARIPLMRIYASPNRPDEQRVQLTTEKVGPAACSAPRRLHTVACCAVCCLPLVHAAMWSGLSCIA